MGRGWLGAALGLDALEFFEGLELRFAGVVDAALEADLVIGSGDEGVAGRVILAGIVGVVDLVVDHFGVDAGETGEEPGVADDVVEEGALQGGGGLVVTIEGFGELGELVGIFAGDDGGFGVDAGLERVQARDGLALDGAWAGGFRRVAAVGFDLT